MPLSAPDDPCSVARSTSQAEPAGNEAPLSEESRATGAERVGCPPRGHDPREHVQLPWGVRSARPRAIGLSWQLNLFVGVMPVAPWRSGPAGHSRRPRVDSIRGVPRGDVASRHQGMVVLGTAGDATSGLLPRGTRDLMALDRHHWPRRRQSGRVSPQGPWVSPPTPGFGSSSSPRPRAAQGSAGRRPAAVDVLWF